jgi:trimeric autotransporter adhesin
MAIIPGISGLFGALNTQQPKFQFQLIPIGNSLLSASFDSRLLNSTFGTIQNLDPRKLPRARDAAVIAPWEINNDILPLDKRVGEVRALKKFINRDPRLDYIKLALNDTTSENLFMMYKAMDNLSVLADFASQKTTRLSTLARLDEQFRSGLAELAAFVPTAKLDKLTMFFGKKNDDVTTAAGVGKNSATIEGPIIQTGGRTDAIAGLTAADQFSIRITNTATLVQSNALIDLSQIVGTISINAVTDLINQQLVTAGVQTRFSVYADAKFDFGLEITGSSLEEVQFIPVNADPQLFITSNFDAANSTTSIGQLTTVNNATTTPLRSEEIDFGGVNTADSVVAAEVAQAKAVEDGTLASFVKADVPPVLAETATKAIASDSEGFLYVLGETKGDLNGQFNASTGNDIFLHKMDSQGNVIFSRLVGTSGTSSAFSLTIDAKDNVIIAGQTEAQVDAVDVFNGKDAFVVKYDKRGEVVFNYQLDRLSTSAALSVAVDANGDVIVGGDTSGAISGTSGFGGVTDGLLLKLDGTTGNILSSQLLGGTGRESIRSVSIAGDGDIIVTMIEDGIGVVRNIDPTNFAVENYNVTLGSIGTGDITDSYIDNDQLYVVGYTDNAALDAGGGATIVNALAGGTDGFIFNTQLKNNNTKENYVTYLGGAGTDKINDVTFSGGNLYVAGSGSSSVNGQSSIGLVDSFVSSVVATTGAVNYTQQFGQTLGTSEALGVAFANTGSNALKTLGFAAGTIAQDQNRDITTQTSIRDGDYFSIRVNGGALRKVTIRDGDNIDDLVRKIKAISFSFMKVTKKNGDFGPSVNIQAIKDSTVELFAGKDGSDALKKLGMAPGQLVSANLLLNVDKDPKTLNDDDLGGVFSLDLLAGLNIADKASAKFSLTSLTTSIAQLQRAYRTLVVDPARLDLLEQARLSKGTVPPYLTSRISNFQDALNRLQGFSQSPSTGFFT